MPKRSYNLLCDLLRRLLVPLTLVIVIGGVYAVALAKSFEDDMDRYRLPAWSPSPPATSPEHACAAAPR